VTDTPRLTSGASAVKLRRGAEVAPRKDPPGCMNALRELLQTNPRGTLALAGLIIGLCFGVSANLANFCVMGAMSDWRTSGNLGRLGMVAIAAAVAIAGAQMLDALEVTHLSQSMYLVPRLNWAGAVFGGTLFGFGMVYAGGCASRNLVRAGGGDLRSIIVLLVLAMTALMTISGLLGALRVAIELQTAIPAERLGTSAPSLSALAEKLGLSPFAARIAASALLILPLLAFVLLFARPYLRTTLVAGGLAAGLLVTAAWLITGLSYDEMSVKPFAPTGLTFVRPVADAFDWIARSTALGLPAFGAATVFGVLLGSALVAFVRRNFHTRGFADTNDLLRHLGGAVGMGIGGAMALGCSVGQGLSGLSTLSLQSILAAASILAGANLGLARLERTV